MIYKADGKPADPKHGSTLAFNLHVKAHSAMTA